MTRADLLSAIDALAASDPAFAALVAARASDTAIAAALEATLPPVAVPYLITLRGIRRVLGAHEGRVFVSALREAAAVGAGLPEAHPAYDALWWPGELLPNLEAGGQGIDIGDAETRAALRGLAALGPALGTPHVVTTAHCDALDAASSAPATVSVEMVSDALNSRSA